MNKINPKKIPPLKNFVTCLYTPDSSADRMTGTPHSKIGEASNIYIKDEELNAKTNKQVSDLKS